MDNSLRGRCRGTPSGWLVLAMVICLFGKLQAAPPKVVPLPKDHLFSTWRGGMEADKAASIWLIKRHLDPEAVFRFFPRGKRIEEGMTFEVPFAVLGRGRNLSLFETLLGRIEEPERVLLEIARIVHDVEINVWGHKVTPEASGLEVVVRGMSELPRTDEQAVEQALSLFDALAAGLKARSRQ